MCLFPFTLSMQTAFYVYALTNKRRFQKHVNIRVQIIDFYKMCYSNTTWKIAKKYLINIFFLIT